MSLSTLPVELVFNILLSLPYHDVINYCRTDTQALNICRDFSFWRLKAKHNLNIDLNTSDYLDIVEPSRKYYQALKYFASEGTDSQIIQAIKLGLVDDESLNDILERAVNDSNLRIIEYLTATFNFDADILRRMAITSLYKWRVDIFDHFVHLQPDLIYLTKF